MSLTNAQVAAVLDELADLLEFQGANPFRVRAYRAAARTLGDLAEPLADWIDDPSRSLTELPGIGEDLAEKITTLLRTGDIPLRQELLAEIPESVLALLRVPGLGPKKAAALFRELHVTSLDELRAACEAQRVRALKGFGGKTEQTILAGLAIASQAGQRIYWAEADALVEALRHWLAPSSVPGLIRLEPAGSYRRGKETVGDLDMLAVAANAGPVMDRLAAWDLVREVLARGDTKMSVRLAGGLQVDLRVVEERSFGAAWQYFTGSKEHNVAVRGRAKDRGLKVNEYGVFRDEESVAGRTEEEVYAALGLPWIPPELREARHEFEWAESGELPQLLELTDLCGDLHMHTTATDGAATLDEMAQGALARGLRYIAITDHSKRVSMANGLDGRRLRAQWDEIDRLNAQLGRRLTVLKGIEVDILEKGGLDLDDDVLAEADWVVASVHYGQNQSREQITKRICDAVAHPSVSAIAHPTGRLLLRREPYAVDLEAVYATAREHGKLLELNANPARLDLNDLHAAAAKAAGVGIVISTDAHAVAELDKLRYGVVQARRAGLTRDDVANTRPWAELKRRIGKPWPRA